VRVLIQSQPFTQFSENQSWHLRGLWPCRWISGRDLGQMPYVVAYKKCFSLDYAETIRAHVSADERYELFLDGRHIGRGSEYGAVDNWYYETYDIPVDKGEHVIVALVWSLGDRAPHAQTTLCHGFIFAPDEKFSDLLGTGTSEWSYKKIEGISFVVPSPGLGTRFWGTGANEKICADKFPWGFEKGTGEDWKPVQVLHPGTNGDLRNGAYPSHLMRPAVLPTMMEKDISTGIVRFVSMAGYDDVTQMPVLGRDNLYNEMPRWDLIGKDKSITILPHSVRRVIYDLENYYCAYPFLITSGGSGSRIDLQWAESLFNERQALTKGNRDQIEGKYLLGMGDVFFPDGGKHRTFKTLWWRAGRYLQLLVKTSDESLTIERLKLCETRYPLDMESSFNANDIRLSKVIPIAFRTLQMCAHETYIDCPYYEQLMYSGDTRLKMLTTMVTTRDDYLPRKAIETFDNSRLASGLTRSQFPGRCLQVIAPFSLAWIGMVHDFALWRGDREFIRRRMPGVRNVIEGLMLFRNRDGLIACPSGWNFIDWVPNWKDGVPPGAECGVNSIINWYMIYTLGLASRLEKWMNEPELKARWERIADELACQTTTIFWDAKQGLFADESERTCFSEHAQCLAVLSGKLDTEKQNRIRHSLVNAKNLARTTISFTHFLFEAYRELNLTDAFFQRLGLWFDLESHGFKTTPEQPEPSRSDCHGWGSHPLYHYFATILGIRPDSMGFTTVDIRPQLGSLREIKAKLVHPAGCVEADFTVENRHLSGTVLLPHGIDGTLRYNNRSIPLQGGIKQSIDC
jgi:alpha-L-rhamnosidase